MVRAFPVCLILALSFSLGLFLPAIGLPQVPSIEDIRPRAVRPGATVELVLTGEHVAGVTDLWTSFKADTELAPTSAGNRVSCRMTLAPDAQVGVGGLRLANPSGVSSLQLFMIDDLGSVGARGDNSSLERAQSLPWPVAVDGRVQANQRLYFSFRAARGQRVAVDVLAQRLGSRFDPVLRVLDSAGRELAYVDDTPGVAPDCRVAFEAPATGDYAVELRDARYQGGENAFFRLRVGDFPLATVPYPIGLTPGLRASVAVAGFAPIDVPPLEVEVPESSTLRALRLGVRSPRGRSSDSISLVIDSLTECLEVEPNDFVSGATEIDLPAAVNGRLDRPRDRDCFVFSARKGERLSIQAMTRSVGAPTDLYFVLLDADGRVVASADLEGADDGSLSHRFEKDGRYALRVEGLNREGGPEHAYRLRVEPFEPEVTLSVDKESVNVRPGDELELEVQCERREYNGPVALSIVSDGSGWKLVSGAVIEKGKTSSTLKAVAPAALAPGRCHVIRIAGEIHTGGTKTRVFASTRPALRRLFPRTAYPPRALDGVIGLGVTGASR